jgi:hypothetical protein
MARFHSLSVLNMCPTLRSASVGVSHAGSTLLPLMSDVAANGFNSKATWFGI